MHKAGDLVDTLNSFTDPNELAKFLTGHGVKGYKQDESSCPISNWVRCTLNFEEWTVLTVSTEDEINVYTEYGDSETYEISDVVKKFIATFDEGGYPSLELEEESDYGW